MANKSVVIIGSGIGGLVAGNLLAKRGHKVSIFESHTSPGGYTAGFYRNGFYFESGTLSFEASPSIFKAMKDLGVFDKVSFVRQKARWVSEDFDSILDSYQGFKNMLYAAFPSDRDSLDKYFSEVDKMYNAVSQSWKSPMPLLYSGLPLLFARISFILNGMKSMKLSKEYGELTIGEFNAQFFELESRLYRLLTDVGYPDMGASLVGGMMTMVDDYWTVHEGMQSWSNALADNFKKLGGELRLSAYVDTILTRNGAAIGVSSKDTAFYGDYVISACDYKKTFLKLLDNRSLVPAALQEKIEKDRIIDIVNTQPKQQQVVLYSIISIHLNGKDALFTGEVYELYKLLCSKTGMRPLTQRRISDILAELDMLGIINAKVISKGRYGRTREISLVIPPSTELKVKQVLEEVLQLS